MLSQAAFSRGHELKFTVPDNRVDCRMHLFCVRIVKAWNGLPNNVVSVSNVSAFTAKIKDLNLSPLTHGV